MTAHYVRSIRGPAFPRPWHPSEQSRICRGGARVLSVSHIAASFEEGKRTVDCLPGAPMLKTVRHVATRMRWARQVRERGVVQGSVMTPARSPGQSWISTAESSGRTVCEPLAVGAGIIEWSVAGCSGAAADRLTRVASARLLQDSLSAWRRRMALRARSIQYVEARSCTARRCSAMHPGRHADLLALRARPLIGREAQKNSRQCLLF